MNTDQGEIIEIARLFETVGEACSAAPLGNGLINDTYKVETSQGRSYVLQRINDAVFRDVDLLQSNIVAVTDHLRKRLSYLKGYDDEDLDTHVLRFMKVKDSQKTFCMAGGGWWRLSLFIDAKSYDSVDPHFSLLAGKAFGLFDALMSDYKGRLGETIPNFHNMEFRLCQFDEAVRADAAKRLDEVDNRAVVAEINSFRDQMCKAERLGREGKLPKRICHCDTKVNNMMFNSKGEVQAIIDLDTVMPSFIFSDYGDFLRTAGSTAAEDEKDLSKVSFRKDIFEAFTKGFLESVKSFLSPVEKENLPYGVALFPYMQAVRFFTDYLNGDTYYKTKYPEHNLVRTRNQMKLFHEIMNNMDYMANFIQNL